ncbi:early growth response protein 1-like isoform X2 [Sycon ciliatum]|uniref:early growth response protein 1-like isoform X2 n=1 Tax=Sycon ciliatum TaxID=27933 RepID=UPI0031F6AB7E
MLARWVPISYIRPSADGTEKKKKKEEYCVQEYIFGKGYSANAMRHDEYTPIAPSPKSIGSISATRLSVSGGGSVMDTRSSSSSTSSNHLARAAELDGARMLSPHAASPAGASLVSNASLGQYQNVSASIPFTQTRYTIANAPQAQVFMAPQGVLAMCSPTKASSQMSAQPIYSIQPATQYRVHQTTMTPQGTPPMIVRSPVSAGVASSAGALPAVAVPHHPQAILHGVDQSQLVPYQLVNGAAPVPTSFTYPTGLPAASPVSQPPVFMPVTAEAPILQLPIAVPTAMHQVGQGTPDSERRESAAVSPPGRFGSAGGATSDGQALVRERRLYGNPASDPAAVAMPGGRHSYRCVACNLTFAYRHQLEQHFMAHRGLQKQILCHICGKCFPRADHVNRHASSKHTAATYACQLCDEDFSKAYSLHKHWKDTHIAHVGLIRSETATMGSTSTTDDEKPGEDPNKMEVDVGEPLASAILNGQPFVVTGNLTSSGVSSAITASTSMSADSRQHVAASAGQPRGVRGEPMLPRRYQCEQCNRSFARSAHLQRHRRIHTGEKPFTCFKCFRFYARGDYLRTHLTTQHNRTAMECEVCSEQYDTINKLLEHMKARHGRAKPWFLQRSDRPEGQAASAMAPSDGMQEADAWSTCGVGDVDRDDLDTPGSVDGGDDDSYSEEGDM